MGATTDQINANLATLGLSNPSQLALLNKIAQGLGIVVDNTIQEFSNSENRILASMSSKNYGKAGYYTGIALAFQYGDNLVTDPTTLDLVYAVINPQNQIINQAAFEEIVTGSNSQLFLKVATIDPLTGNLMPLSAPQLAAFISYYSNFQLPGLPISIISLPPNVLNFVGTVTYLKTYDLSTLQTAIQTALNTFKQAFPFDGVFYVGDLETQIRLVPGVRDFFVTGTTIDGAGFSGNTALQAGYFNYPDGLFDSLTYNPVNS